MSQSIHQYLSGLARANQMDKQARTVAYLPPDGRGRVVTELMAVYGSSKDTFFDSASGTMRRREVTVRVDKQHGAPTVSIGGTFMLDPDGSGVTAAYVVESFPNADDGWHRCMCVREEKRDGRYGQNRTDK